MRFTEEELAIAKQVDLCEIAAYLGYTVKRVGRLHTLKEMDSIRIYDRSHWFRWSRQGEKGENGGSQIDFLRVFAGMDIKEAVFWLLDFAGYQRNEPVQNIRHIVTVEKKEAVSKPFILPQFAGSNAYLYNYLENERYIDREVIDYFVNAGLIYEAKRYHNIVFIGTDKNGVPKFASMRGVFDRNGKAFKCDVAGNDKRYGFHLYCKGSEKLVVFEAAIDLMSYITMYRYDRASMLAFGMLADAPLETFLTEHPEIKTIQFCLDNDKPGRKATDELMEKYRIRGYQVKDKPPQQGCKDYNQWLQESRKQQREKSGRVI